MLHAAVLSAVWYRKDSMQTACGLVDTERKDGKDGVKDGVHTGSCWQSHLKTQHLVYKAEFLFPSCLSVIKVAARYCIQYKVLSNALTACMQVAA